MVVTRWDQCPRLALRTESVAVSQDLEDTSVIDVYRLVIMDSQTASVSDTLNRLKVTVAENVPVFFMHVLYLNKNRLSLSPFILIGFLAEPTPALIECGSKAG